MLLPDQVKYEANRAQNSTCSGIGIFCLQVTHTGEPQLSPEMLKVVNQTPEGVQSMVERHLIPYVPEIVKKIDADTKRAYIQPPKGLLQLGRKQLLLDIIYPRILVDQEKMWQPCVCAKNFAPERKVVTILPAPYCGSTCGTCLPIFLPIAFSSAVTL